MPMPKTVPMIGLLSGELHWIRLLVSLLRHPDPNVPQLAHHALLYLTESCTRPNRLASGIQPPPPSYLKFDR